MTFSSSSETRGCYHTTLLMLSHLDSFIPSMKSSFPPLSTFFSTGNKTITNVDAYVNVAVLHILHNCTHHSNRAFSLRTNLREEVLSSVMKRQSYVFNTVYYSLHNTDNVYMTYFYVFIGR